MAPQIHRAVHRVRGVGSSHLRRYAGTWCDIGHTR